jgi:hypothetical protein
MIIDEPDDAGVTAREQAQSSPRLAAARSHGGRGSGSATARVCGRGRGLVGYAARAPCTACCDGARPHGSRDSMLRHRYMEV